MYDNYNSRDGQFLSTRNLIRATKANPCPHCGKPDWCYSIGELSVCNRDQPPATGWEATSKTDKEGHVFYARPQEKKPPRPAQTRYWEYPDRNGSPLARVERVDDGEGNKKIKQQRWDKDKKQWLYGLGTDKDLNRVARASIPIYRYAEVQKAIVNGKPIFIVEGETCADILWNYNLAATCNLGGTGKFTLTDSLDLQNPKVVVIVPDRDIPGIEHAEKIAERFPEAMWLYPFPESKAWENLPKSQGLDIADWIDQEKLSLSQVRAAIGEKKVFEAPPQTAKVISPEKFQIPDIAELGREIEQLLESDLKKSQLQLKISELAQKFRVPSADIWKIYRDREEELEQDANQEDTAVEVARLIASKSASLKLSEILPESLAEPIDRLAKISARDVSLAFDSKHRPKSQQIREWFGELVSMKYGEVTTKGQSILFISSTLSTLSTLSQKPCPERITGVDNPCPHLSTLSTPKTHLDGQSVDKCGYSVDNPIHTFKPLVGKSLEASVDSVDTKTPPSKILQPLMQSCTTTKTAKPETAKPELEVADKVVVAHSENSMYRGQRGRVAEVYWLRDSKQEITILFDKLVHGMQQVQFPAADVMRIQ